MFSIPEPLPSSPDALKFLPDCPQCGGRGYVLQSSSVGPWAYKHPCSHCGGRGYVAPFNSCDICRARNATSPGPEPAEGE